jgi:Protoglobin
MATAPSIPGYRYGDPTLPRSPVSAEDLARLKAVLLFSDDDLAALRRAGDILVPQTQAIVDAFYGFFGSQDPLLASFSTPQGPSPEYQARVFARFGQWIADTCRAQYDEAWLAYQQEIGRRHFTGKNETDGPAAAGTPPLVPLRYITALVYPAYATVRPFLEKGETDPAAVERMHQAWLKAVLLQVTLWSQPYVRDGAW